MTHALGTRACFVALLLAVLLGACAPAGTTTFAPSATPRATAPAAMSLEVSVADAVALRDQGALMLDVREPDEFAAGHISGATLIPLGQLAGRLGEVPRDRVVVVVCRTGHRAAQGRDILLGAGYSAVTSMTGGMTEWLAAGQPIVTGS